MSIPKKTVSKVEINEEWQQILAARRDPAMFRPLYEKYFEAIFRFIFSRTSDESLSSDISSQVFLKAMQRIKNYEFRGVPFSAWLFRIATNELAQHFRQHKKSRVVSIEEIQLEEMADEMEGRRPRDFKQRLINALDGLKEEDLQLIEMRFFEQRSFKEISEILGITENNAKVKAFRILKRMKKKHFSDS